MANKRAYDEMFIEGTIHIVAEIGIENMRTKHVADHAGFSEATMYRMFPTKEILLREAFLYVYKKICGIPAAGADDIGDRTPDEWLRSVWHNIYRYLIDNREETIFFIRYRYSSLYTDDVRNLMESDNGGLDRLYGILEDHCGIADHSLLRMLVSCIFELTLCFSEKIVTGKLNDDHETEELLWAAVNSTVKAWTRTV